MRVILTTLGTSGDVTPIAMLARALLEQGDEAIVVTNPHFAAQLEAAGIDHRSSGAPWDPVTVADDARFIHPTRAPFAAWTHCYEPRVRPFFETVRELIDEAPTAAVVNHFWCFGGFLAASLAGVPCVNVVLAPGGWISSQDAGAYEEGAPPRWRRRLSAGFARFVMNMSVGRDLKRIGKSLDLDYEMDYFSAQQRSDLNVGLWSPTLRGVASDDPPRSVVAGFPSSDTHASLSPELEAFLDAGPPPVILGLGSALPTTARDVYRNVLEACVALGQRVLLIGGDPAELPALPTTAFAVPSAPYTAVFGRGSVTIHHAGIGTLAEALRAGRPSVLIPFTNDQPDNAQRAERLGQGVVVPRDGASREHLQRAIERCLDDDAMRRRATAIGQHLASEQNGAVTTARLLRERLVRES